MQYVYVRNNILLLLKFVVVMMLEQKAKDVITKENANAKKVPMVNNVKVVRKIMKYPLLMDMFLM